MLDPDAVARVALNQTQRPPAPSFSGSEGLLLQGLSYTSYKT